ncbi:MAG: response regulator [Waddliaceae bacterium]
MVNIQKLKKILLAEDDLDIQEITCFALRSIGGYSVDVCSSGVEVLEKIDKIHPQLILLDVMMPDMDGVETLRRLRDLSQYQEIPVIFFTAKIQSDDIARYINSGVSDVIPKPFDPLLLSDTIEEIWNKWHSD